MDSFLAKIEAGYGCHGNPYHNATHAADVAATTHYFLHSLGLKVSVNNKSHTALHVHVHLHLHCSRVLGSVRPAVVTNYIKSTCTINFHHLIASINEYNYIDKVVAIVGGADHMTSVYKQNREQCMYMYR